MRRTSSALPVMALYALLTTALCALFPISPPRAGTDSHPDLSGTWLLNEEFSDDIEAKLQEARRQRRSRSAPGSRGGMGRGGMGGRGSGSGPSGGMPPMGERRPGGRDPEEMRRRMQQLVQGLEILLINYEDPMLSIRFADGRQRAFRTDGKKQSRKTADGAVVTRAKWKKDGLLTVFTSTPWGRETTETYELITETDQLRLITEIHQASGMPPLELVRVYDREGAATEDESRDKRE